jgi:hypothetical protein
MDALTKMEIGKEWDMDWQHETGQEWEKPAR